MIIRSVSGIKVDYNRRNRITEQVLRTYKVIHIDQLRSVFTVYKRGGVVDGSTSPLVRRRTVEDWAKNIGWLNRSGDWFLVGQGAAKTARASSDKLPHDAICTSIALDLELNRDAGRLLWMMKESADTTKPDLIYITGHHITGSPVVAFEIELTQKSYRRYVEILASHQARVNRGDYQRVLYLCRSERIATTVSKTADELGYKSWLRVELLGDYVDRYFTDLPGWEYAIEERRRL